MGKVLGFNVHTKQGKNDKTPSWYAVRQIDNTAHWVYVGKNSDDAEFKIRRYLDKNNLALPEDAERELREKFEKEKEGASKDREIQRETIGDRESLRETIEKQGEIIRECQEKIATLEQGQAAQMEDIAKQNETIEQLGAHVAAMTTPADTKTQKPQTTTKKGSGKKGKKGKKKGKKKKEKPEKPEKAEKAEKPYHPYMTDKEIKEQCKGHFTAVGEIVGVDKGKISHFFSGDCSRPNLIKIPLAIDEFLKGRDNPQS